jgi:hypothetical protein
MLKLTPKSQSALIVHVAFVLMVAFWLGAGSSPEGSWQYPICMFLVAVFAVAFTFAFIYSRITPLIPSNQKKRGKRKVKEPAAWAQLDHHVFDK